MKMHSSHGHFDSWHDASLRAFACISFLQAAILVTTFSQLLLMMHGHVVIIVKQ